MSLMFVLGVNMALVVLETFLYALLLVSASTTLYLRFVRHEVPKLLVWNPVVLFTVLISAMSGTHWILTIVDFFDAFVGSEAHADRFFNLQHLLGGLSVLIGDVAIVHRLWLISNHSFSVIIVPILACLGLLIVECATTYVGNQPAAEAQILVWVRATWVLSLNQCFLYRAYGEGTHVPVLIVLLESSAAWSIWGFFFGLTSELGSPLVIIAAGLAPVMVGLTNLVIYLRVELQCTRPQGSDLTGVALTSSASIIPYYASRVSAQIPHGAA
ncbi:hypothetical protein B0H16DRAFT_1718236 [Mycena metata]|uniref:Uncharacterized protein n=1 Tax=Mycena metata TaxID=1033252 RepID=A0AAD7NJ96_9AGAR|nr:hypothetical protein B0H16DRAFT_1718236 [Mycena metata]